MTLPKRLWRAAPPLLVSVVLLAAWEAIVRIAAIPPFELPAPSLILTTLYFDRETLLTSLLVTLRITFSALLAATLGGTLIAIVFSRWRWLERSFLPIAIILQVTPIIAIAPLLLIYLNAADAVLVCAFLVAFFPILANTSIGLASTDRNLVDLFKLSGASAWQEIFLLRLPAAMPYFMAGLKIGGGLALIGAIAGELAAGASGDAAGLAFRIVEAGYRMNIPRMFAALLLISFTGLAIYGLMAFASEMLLRHWHDSARSQD
jgi:NitT/TauT family transport system permease protein